MSEELTGYYRNSNGILKQKVAEEAQVASSPSALSAEVLERLEGMTREGLRELLQRVSQAGWGYGKLTGKELLEMALKTKDEAYEALKLTALTLAVNAGDWREFNALATFWAEREKGKPVQSVNATVQIGVIELVEEATRKRREKQKMIDVTPQDVT
jgi:hypothetical protein